MKALAALTLSLMLLLSAGCSSDEKQKQWVDDEVSFQAEGLTIHGTYRHQRDAAAGPAALLISESGNTDRNGDNAVVGPIGNMKQLAEQLSDHGVASLRYDKVGTGKTGLGPYQQRPTDVGSAVYTSGAKAAARFLAEQPGTDKARLSVYALGEGTVHAMSLASDTSPDAPKIHSLGLLQPLSGRYLDIITNRVRSDASPETLNTWLAAVDEVVKFVPAGQDAVPEDEFWTPEGRAVRDAEPGRFRLDRLLVVRDTYRDLVRETGAR